MPMPVSLTRTMAERLCLLRVRTIWPSQGVYCRAFSSKFEIKRVSWASSPITDTLAIDWYISAIFFSCAIGSNDSTKFCTILFRVIGCHSRIGVATSTSARAKKSKSCAKRLICVVALAIEANFLASLGWIRSGWFRITSTDAWITLKGPRSSWEASAVNCLSCLKLLSIGSSAFCVSQSPPIATNPKVVIPPIPNPQSSWLWIVATSSVDWLARIKPSKKGWLRFEPSLKTDIVKVRIWYGFFTRFKVWEPTCGGTASSSTPRLAKSFPSALNHSRLCLSRLKISRQGTSSTCSRCWLPLILTSTKEGAADCAKVSSFLSNWR